MKYRGLYGKLETFVLNQGLFLVMIIYPLPNQKTSEEMNGIANRNLMC